MIGDSISLVKNALNFYKAFISGVSESELEKIASTVNPKWSKKAMWIYIFARLGLSYSSKNLAKSKNAKAINHATLKPFFEDEVIFERQI